MKIKRKNGTKKAALAIGRKLAVIMHKMLVEKTEFIYGEKKTKKKCKFFKVEKSDVKGRRRGPV